uniref:Uncharacterized protein n=1 Tax=Arundo donax TaxID=35708 RepID=A0A0A8XZ29_ARUDO
MCNPLIHETDAALVLHGHRCWCQLLTWVMASDSATLFGTHQIPLGTWVRGCPTRQKKTRTWVPRYHCAALGLV